MYDEIIKKLFEFYAERGRKMPLEYDLGFFDALAVIRDMQSSLPK